MLAMKKGSTLFRGLVVLFVLCCACCTPNAYAEPDVWVSTIARSYHLNREANYHESNLGLGGEYVVNREWRIVGGEYTNSIRQHSNYAGGAWLPLNPTSNVRLGLTGIIVTGYTSRPVPVGVPTLVWEYKSVGINFMSVGVVSAVQFKLGF